MLISRNWLQTFFNTPLPDAGALGEALTFHAFEIDGIEKKGNDDVLDVKITPNRGHDALSHRGIAHELSAILQLPMADDPLLEVPVLAPTTEALKITVEDPAFCSRYIGALIQGVEVRPSPQWLSGFLESIGQRSINNVVDATNYVMFHIGQPMHAFDAAKLSQKDGGYAIAVRGGREGEKMLALDKKEYALSSLMSVIADAYKDEAIGIAGIKGGEPAGVTESTRDIILESATFNGVSVRKTAQALKLRTDASARFEQVLSPSLAASGMHLAVTLIREIAEGELMGIVDAYPKPQKETRITVSLMQVNRVLGTALSGAEVAAVFSRLGFSYKEQHEEFEVVVPHERLDLTIPEDLIEEVVRILGYEKIAEAPLPPFEAAPAVNAQFAAAEAAREALMAQGYSEIYTSVFAEEGERAVLNKADSVKPFMRTTLLPGLEEALKKNISSKDILGLKEIRLFELGFVWKKGKETLMLGTIREKKPATEAPLEEAAQGVHEKLPLSATVQFRPFSKYPYIVRDIAVWTPASSNKEEGYELAEKIIAKEAGELLQKISLFDRFEKNERVSLGFRLIFQSFERTLTETEAHDAMQKVSAALAEKGFEIR